MKNSRIHQKTVVAAVTVLISMMAGPSPAAAIHEDVERCNQWAQEFINDIDVLPQNSNKDPVDECVPDDVDPEEVFTFEPTGDERCIHFCEPEKVQSVRLDGDALPNINIYLIWCNVLLPTGHTVITAQVSLENDCLEGTRNCELPCFGILDEVDVGEGQVEVPLPSVCEQSYELRVFGVFVTEGPFQYPC